MLLYRAVNIEDIKNLENKEDIKCSLIRTYQKKSRISSGIYYDLCIKKERQYALDVIAGHIAGNRLRVGLSPWISTSKDFSFVCSEYAIPQAGAYNEAGVRKPIILIEQKDILTTIDQVKPLREEKIKEDIIIDLSNNNLNNLYGQALMSEAYNKKMPGYNWIKDFNYELNPNAINVNGLSNYASYAKEVLFFKQIRNNNIKLIIYPILQDILYGCNIDIKEIYEFLEKNVNNIYKFFNVVENIYCKEDKELFKYLYPNNKIGNNLTDYLYNNYNSINGNDIYEKYDHIKNRKRDILRILIQNFNDLFNSNFKLGKILDDEILVIDLENLNKITEKQINDLLIVKSGNILYKYDSKEKKYIFENKQIAKSNIRKLIKEDKKLYLEEAKQNLKIQK